MQMYLKYWYIKAMPHICFWVNNNVLRNKVYDVSSIIWPMDIENVIYHSTRTFLHF